MPWSGSGVYSRTNGTFTGPTIWAEDKAAGTLITTTNHDTHDEDLGDGINACLTKNGENTPSTNLPMGGFAHTGVGNATARTQYPSVASLQDGTHRYKADGGAADAYAITPVPAIASYAEGQRFVVKIANANTGASTLNVSALGTKTILKDGATALVAGDLLAGAVVALTYDGTDFQLDRSVNPDFGSAGIAADVIAESTAAAGVTIDGVLLKDNEVTAGSLIAVALTTTGNITVGGQFYSPSQTLTPGASIAWNTNSGNFAIVTLNQASTLESPSNDPSGGVYTLIVKQDGTGGRTLAYGNAYHWPGGTPPPLSTGANAVDVLRFFSDSTRMYGVFDLNFS